MSRFKLQRLGMMMEPEPGNADEVEGVLNPAATRGPYGQLYLFPRLVAKCAYLRIGRARVEFNEAGDLTGVERLGIALEPKAIMSAGPPEAPAARMPAPRMLNRLSATSCLTQHSRP